MPVAMVPEPTTTMFKVGAGSRLAWYERYVGVRLREPGRELAALVFRRHRVVELCLVQCLGMGWADAQDDAERLLAAVLHEAFSPQPTPSEV